MIEVLDPTDVDAIKFILDFMATSLKKPLPATESNTNSEKWVRNQAMQNFGQIIHAAHLKNSKNQLSAKITEVCNGFYDLEFLKSEKLANNAEDSFMTDDDTEKIKEMWAFHMPCVLLVQKADYWQRLKPIY